MAATLVNRWESLSKTTLLGSGGVKNLNRISLTQNPSLSRNHKALQCKISQTIQVSHSHTQYRSAMLKKARPVDEILEERKSNI